VSSSRYIIGSAIHEMLAMPAGSVDLVVTSPPFLGLRDYLAADDPMKEHEHGAVATPLEFVHQLLDTVEAAGHVLAPHGSLVIELGDSMAGSGGAGGDYYNADGLRAGQPKPAGSAKLSRSTTKGRRRDGDDVPRTRDVHKAARSYVDPSTQRRPGVPAMQSTGVGWPEDKSLAMIPEMLRLAMGYGMVPFSDRTTERWMIRNVVRWCKPNPSVGDEGDKFRRATNDVLVATRSATRYWDKLKARRPSRTQATATSPLLDYWELPTGTFKGSHHATFPLEFVAPFVETLAPERVCTVCGEPSRRLVRRTDEYDAQRGGGDLYGNHDGNDRGTGRNGGYTTQGGAKRTGLVAAEYEHVGWSDCGHDSWRRGIVLDPYAGTGTTLAAANGLGRDGLGIDADRRNAELAVDRIGPMWLTIEEGHAHVVQV